MQSQQRPQDLRKCRCLGRWSGQSTQEAGPWQRVAFASPQPRWQLCGPGGGGSDWLVSELRESSAPPPVATNLSRSLSATPRAPPTCTCQSSWRSIAPAWTEPASRSPDPPALPLPQLQPDHGKRILGGRGGGSARLGDRRQQSRLTSMCSL